VTTFQSGSNFGDNLPYLIYEVYRSQIEEKVIFGDLIHFMPIMREKFSEIYKLEKSGNKKEAAEVFFDYLKTVNEEGKYQVLLFTFYLRFHVLTSCELTF
jgi:hypothetical protein